MKKIKYFWLPIVFTVVVILFAVFQCLIQFVFTPDELWKQVFTMVLFSFMIIASSVGVTLGWLIIGEAYELYKKLAERKASEKVEDELKEKKNG